MPPEKKGRVMYWSDNSDNLYGSAREYTRSEWDSGYSKTPFVCFRDDLLDWLNSREEK